MKTRNVLLVSLAMVASAMIAVSAPAVGALLGLDPQSQCCGLDRNYDWPRNSGAVSNQVAQMAMQAVPYPLAQIKAAGGFLERQNLRERLLRFNNPSKLGYVYELSALGKYLGYFTIKGKISSTNSQLTETDQVTTWGGGGYTLASVGDDGTWGPEELGPNGVFFFTTTGVMVETNNNIQYSDAPLQLPGVPNLTPTRKPSSVSAFWKKK